MEQIVGFKLKKKISPDKIGALIEHGLGAAQVLYPGDENRNEQKEWVIDLVNSQVDLPILNEGQERIIIGIIVDIIDGVIANARKRRS